jgi:hypothetical protein
MICALQDTLLESSEVDGGICHTSSQECAETLEMAAIDAASNMDIIRIKFVLWRGVGCTIHDQESFVVSFTIDL